MKAILIFGDSIVTGRGEGKGWVGRIKENYEKKDYYNVVYNLGIPGETTTELLKRINNECKVRIVKKRKKDKFTIIIGIGMNDIPKKTNFEKNIKKINQIAEKYAKTKFIEITNIDEKKTLPYEKQYYYNKKIEEYNKIIRKNTKSIKIKLNPKDLGDGIHPNKKGYEKMYKQIKTQIATII